MERELWKLLYAVACHLDKSRRCWKYRTSDILATYWWGVVNDRPLSWCVQRHNWPPHLFERPLPSQATLSRRLRRVEVEQLMTEIERVWLLLATVGRLTLVRWIDGKPLPVGNATKDRDAAYGRGAGGMQKGYKLHVVWSEDTPLPWAWALTPMNGQERIAARSLIPQLLGGGYLLGDTGYDSNPLYELAQEAGFQLLAPPPRKARGVGHVRQSAGRLRSLAVCRTNFGREMLNLRRGVERQLGNLVSFGCGLICLPAWVRRFPRVRNWVQAKILVNAARWFKNHRNAPAVA